MIDSNEKWEKAKEYIESQTTDLSYKLFIEPLQFCVEDNCHCVIYLSWPKQLQLITHVNFHYMGIIEQAVKSVWGIYYTAIIMPESEYAKLEGPLFSDCYIKASELNNDNRFDTFVVGESNQAAFDAAEITGEFPLASFNPLLIYGDSGLGKTHLLQAVALYITEHESDLKVLYTSAKTLTDRLYESIERGTIQLLRLGIKKYDVLIVDDIEYMQWQDIVLEEFLYIVGMMYKNQKHVMIAGNSAAVKFMGLDIRLKKRFVACAAVEIKQPEYEVKKHILIDFANKQGVEMNQDIEEVIDYIAHRADNIFEIQGDFKRMLKYSSFSGEPINLYNARRILEPMEFEDTETDDAIETDDETGEDVLSKSLWL